MQIVRTRPAKGNIHICINFMAFQITVTATANIFETLHFQLKYTAFMDKKLNNKYLTPHSII